MAVNGGNAFEFRLGKLGLTLFVIGMSCLIFAAFQCGIMVGKDMDAYPEKAVNGLPGFIKQKIVAQNTAPPAASIPKQEEIPDKQEKTDMDLTFYDTLSGKKTKPAPPAIQPEEKGETDPVKDSIKESAVSQEPVKVKTESKEKAAITENKEETNSKETFIIQVVSLKDQKKAEEIKDHLKKLGYNSELDSTHSHGKKLYRVKLTGYETRNEAVKIATAIEKKIQLKCIVLGSK